MLPLLDDPDLRLLSLGVHYAVSLPAADDDGDETETLATPPANNSTRIAP